MNACAASEIGISPSISNDAIFGISTKAAPKYIPLVKIFLRSYPAKAPITIPNTVPIKIGSPNTPNFFCNFSILMSILFTPGILSITQLITIANGT